MYFQIWQLSLVFPPGGTKYVDVAKTVNPSKVAPYWLPTSVVVEKPTGEFGVNLDAEGKAPLILFLLGLNILSALEWARTLKCSGSGKLGQTITTQR